ncbi:MAG: hypothetical protein AB7F28_02845 [Candidatus Margulisiibacteriota bacterium]
MKYYSITKEQVLALWVFGVIFILGDSIFLMDQNWPSGFPFLLLWLVPVLLFFYTLGWWANNPSTKQPRDEKNALNVTEENQIKEVEVKYFGISPKKLVFLLVITSGIYGIFWFYKNWEAEKKYESPNIMPIIRSLFYIFFCYDLFKKVLMRAIGKGYSQKYSARWLAFLLICRLFLNKVLERVPSLEQHTGLFITICIVTLIFGILPLYTVQKAINYYNQEANGPDFKAHKYSFVEIVVILIGVLITAFSFVTGFIGS